MIQVAIVEDDTVTRAEFQAYLHRYAKENGETFHVTEFTDGAEIAEEYKPSFDIILMDVEMHYMNGMKAARQIRKTDTEVTIIFITNMPQYAIEGYQVAALDYVLKPVSYFAFSESIRRAIGNRKHQRSSIVISLKGESRRLVTSRIRYVDVLDHDLCYHTLDGDFVVKDTMKHALEQTQGEPFYQCNKAYLVNLSYVDGVNGSDVIIGKDVLQVSRAKRKGLMDALNNYLATTGR